MSPVFLLLCGSTVCWNGEYPLAKDQPQQPFVTDDYDVAFSFKHYMETTFPQKELGYEIVAASIQVATREPVVFTLPGIDTQSMEADIERIMRGQDPPLTPG